jgi:hypothetical protein
VRKPAPVLRAHWRRETRYAYLAAFGERNRSATIVETISTIKVKAPNMALKIHSGGCHCGAVCFEAEIDIAQGTVKCNCSSCAKARSWLTIVPASRYRLTSGAESQANYQWTPPGKPRPTVEFHFCKICGIRTPGRGEMEAMGGVFYAVQVPLLNEIDLEELAAGPIRYVDGLHDRFDREPADKRFL